MQPQEQAIRESKLYRERSKRANDNKLPSRGTPMGVVAKVRAPQAENRAEAKDTILDRDGGLVKGTFGTVYYQPVTVDGVELKVEPLQPSIGSAIHGIDLANDLTPNMVSYIRELWLERKVLLFRGQDHLTQHQMVEFAGKFGEVGAPFGEREHVPNSPVDINQQVKVPGIPDMLLLPSDETVPNAASGFHADATWQDRPPMGSLLMCRESPPVGGDTLFCDCYAMWEALPLEIKERVKHLKAVHIGTAGHTMDGVTPVSVHPVARTHPETGRTTLYVQQGFVRRFADEHNMPEEEQRDILRRMKLLEGFPEYTCRVRWEPGSLAMWDNRAVLHSASGDFWPHRRFMERLTILDYDESRRTPYFDG